MTKKMEVIQALRFTLANEEDIERMLIHLNDYGYVVIADVASEIEIEQQKNRFWNYIEGLDAGKSGEEIRISRSNVETWKDENWVGNHSTGIIRSPNFCHSDFMWTSRTLPKVKQAFAEVWKNDDLIVSFDAGNAFRPWKYNPQWVTEGNWWHVDQNSRKGPSRQGRVCVQGLVTYYDVNEETGGLCVIPGSHLFHNELCDRSPSGKLMHDYVYIGEDDPILRLNPPVIVGAKAGDLILWDSRLVHCNCPSPKATSKEDLKSNVPSKVSSASSMGKISWTNLKLSNPKLGGELGGGHAETAAGEEKENSIAATTPSSDLEWINISEGSSNHRQPETMNDFELIDDNQGDSSSPRQPQQQQLQGKVSANSIASLTETTRQNESLNTEKISEPSTDLIRLVSYVCMLPRSCATAAVIRSRKRGFLYKVPTSHWPTEMIPLYMTDYRQDHAVNWREVSPEVMKLVGFSSLEIQLRRFRFSEMCREVYNMVM